MAQSYAQVLAEFNAGTLTEAEYSAWGATDPPAAELAVVTHFNSGTGGGGGSGSRFPAWFSGVADITENTEVVQVNDDFDLFKAEADIAPGRWKLFPLTAAGKAAADAYAGVKAPGINASNPFTGAAKAAAGAVGNALGIPQLHNLRDLAGRAVKVIIGVVLIIVGLVKLTGAGKIVGDLPKVV